LRRVQPYIGTGHQAASQRDVVVWEKGHRDGAPQALDVAVQAGDELLSAVIARVRLAGEHDLAGLPACHRCQPVRIV